MVHILQPVRRESHTINSDFEQSGLNGATLATFTDEECKIRLLNLTHRESHSPFMGTANAKKEIITVLM